MKVDNWFLKPILNFKEGCDYCGISRSKMYKHTASGKIPFYKPEGKLIYFLREELDQWLLRNRNATIGELEQEATKRAIA